MSALPLTILILAGGPDREHHVSLSSAAVVSDALKTAGHNVIQRDISPTDTSALEEQFDVIFPVLHGPFGEGGPVQKLLEQRNLSFVGSDSRTAAIAIDKYKTKQIAAKHNINTPASQLLNYDDNLSIPLPVVLKPITEGSSFGIAICHNIRQVDDARPALHATYDTILAEQFIDGNDLTVGILGSQLLPTIKIIPATAFYDYDAKYDRDDTRYIFDIDLPQTTIDNMRADAQTIHHAIGCRHMSRVDFMVDRSDKHWFIEINTIPGFTPHSLLPMAAAKAGIDLTTLYDTLVRLALNQPNESRV